MVQTLDAFHCLFPASGSVFRCGLLPDECHLVCVRFKFGTVKIQDRRVYSVVILNVFIDFSENFIYWHFQIIMDETMECLMAGSIIIHKKHETDISPTQFLKFSGGSVTEQSPCKDERIEHIDAIIAMCISVSEINIFI